MEIGRVGLWHSFEKVPAANIRSGVAAIEELGFKALWIPEALGREIFSQSTLMLGATSELVIAPGIANLHMRTPMSMNSGWRTITEAYPDRFLLGIGVSHAPVVEGVTNKAYVKPLEQMANYLDAMDASPFFSVDPKSSPVRVLAALGPKMLQLAAQRTSGAHPYLVPVAHTKFARDLIGNGPMINTEMKCVITNNREEGLDLARKALSMYLRLPNYRNNLMRFGWTEDDLETMPTDKIETVVAIGDVDVVAARAKEHLDAGASHVCVQVLKRDVENVPLAEWKALSAAVKGV